MTATHNDGDSVSDKRTAPMKSESQATELGPREFLALLGGNPVLLKRLESGERLRVATPFGYPGRYGPVAVHFTPYRDEAGSADMPSVRISDGGDLLKSLDQQGMDLAVDMILSKTVFHVVKEVERANLAGGQVYIDSKVDAVPADTWRLLQLIVEVIGLRHSKYKDALLRLSRRQEGPDLIDWGNH